MDISNIITSSLIITTIIIIVIYYILNEYHININDYIKLSIYIIFASGLYLSYYKNTIIEKHGYEPVYAAAEIFNEISDSQKINGIMTPIQSSIIPINTEKEDFDIDIIPKSITCNNIVVKNNNVDN
jgi:hypothetical protein